MFSVEMDFDETKIILVDDRNNYEDVEINLYDDIIIFRQWDEEEQYHTEIGMSPDMFEEFMSSINSSEGVYVIRTKKT